MATLPSLFVSHGSPMILIDDSEARHFLAELGQSLPRPAAVVVASAHWEAATPTVSGARLPATIHDFGGFAAELYEVRYPAQGAPVLAERIAKLLGEAGLPATIDEGRGLDHGAWVPLSLMYPEADVPVVAISLLEGGGPATHFALGTALRPLRSADVLMLASGSLTHSLRHLVRSPDGEPAPDWVAAFQNWVFDAVQRGSLAALLDYRRVAPGAVRNHPTEEHLMPLFVALGAATPGAIGRRLHESVSYGVLAMDAYAFD